MDPAGITSIILFVVQMVAVVLVGFVAWLFTEGHLLSDDAENDTDRLWHHDHLWMLAIGVAFLVRAMIQFIVDLGSLSVPDILYMPLTVAIVGCMWSMSVWRVFDRMRKIFVAFAVVNAVYVLYAVVSAYGLPLVAVHGAWLLPLIIGVDAILIYFYIVSAATYYEAVDWVAHAKEYRPWTPRQIMYGLTVFLIFSVLNSVIALNYAETPKARLIGFAQPDAKVPRWNKEADYIKEYTHGRDVQVVLRNAGSDSQRQVAQIKEMLALNVGALIVAPVDSEVLYDVVISAYRQDIPIVAYDRLMVNMPVDYYITIDMRDVGRLAAEELAKRHDAARIVYVGGSDTDNNAHLHKQGFEDALNAYEDKDFEIVASWFTERWSNENAAIEMQKRVDEGVAFDAIVAGNDGLAGAAAGVARAAGIELKYVSGGDGDPEACQRIARGEQTMTVYKSIEQLAKEGTKFALDLAAGRDVETEKTTFNGSYYIPTRTIMPVVVTKQSIDDGLFTENCEPIPIE